tara:strand:+ start:1669 stop:2136 length:468 start_codon:yes stop_codon:yes gene_type:complete
MKVYFERFGVFASLVMFLISGVMHVIGPSSSVERLTKAVPFPLNSSVASILIFIAGATEIVASLVILSDLVYDGKLNRQSSVYAYAYLIAFTICVTLLFYANPFTQTFKKTAVLSNVTTAGALSVGLSLALGNSPVPSSLPVASQKMKLFFEKMK